MTSEELQHNDPASLREQLEDALRKRVLDGEFSGLKRLPSVRALASEFHVSLGTVSNALASLKRQGVLSARRKKGIFLLHEPPKRRKRTGNIGVLVEGGGDPMQDQMNFAVFNGVRAEAADAGLNVMYLGPRERTAAGALPKGIREIDALAYVINVAPDPRVIRKVAERDMPVVMTDWFEAKLSADGIVIDNDSAAKASIEHLLRQKHRRIAFINSTGQSADERFAAYRSCLEDAGISYDPRLVTSATPNVLEGQQAMRALLEQRPTAVFTFNDYLAIGAVLAAQSKGLSVPRDLSVVGFGNQGEVLAQGLGLRLATIKVDFVEMGRVAARQMLKRLKGDHAPASKILVPGVLVKGETTAVARS
ncbi:MAG TPA: GntR family transcriptional regulator [Planctomycetota bacterium]|nr:GntR family transcriptional regulator [Planctomycetota bacterium]